MALYSKVEYWDERYENSPNESTEWYQGYRTLRHLFKPSGFAVPGKGNCYGRLHGMKSDGTSQAMETIPEQQQAVSSAFPDIHDARVLILGCGNGSFAEDMRDDGWTGRMINLDFSKVVIEDQKEKYRHFSPKMEFVCHDIRDGLPFPDAAFDLIISKASFDAVLCGPSPVGYARSLIQEVVRCLAPGHGIFFLVTTGNPDSRLLYLEHRNDLYHYWDHVRHLAVPRAGSPRVKSKMDYVYISRRRSALTNHLDPSSSEEEPDSIENKPKDTGIKKKE